MPTNMVAFIEYDEEELDWERWGRVQGRTLPLPFALGSRIESLTDGGALYAGSKGYAFFGAIAGVRNQTEIPPLYPPRGEPAHLTWRVLSAVQDAGAEIVGWLTLAEINAALAHHGVPRDRVNDATVTLLEIMETLERRYGVGRVRLLFYFV